MFREKKFDISFCIFIEFPNSNVITINIKINFYVILYYVQLLKYFAFLIYPF